MAVATARSTAGSSIFIPPTTFTKISLSFRFIFNSFSITAMIIESLFKSIPWALLCGTG